MTVETSVSKVIAPGNGSATTFSFSPVVLPEGPDDLEVLLRNVSTGAETLLTRGTSSTTYSVSVSSYPGTGSITYPASGGAPITAAYEIVMRRILELEQQTNLPNQSTYFPEVLEAALDRATMVDIQQQEKLDRTPGFLPGVDLGDITFDPDTIPAPEADKVLAINSTATGFTLVAVPSASLVTSAQTAATNAAIAQAAAEAAAVEAEGWADLVPVPADPGDDGKFLRANGGVFELGSPVAGGDVVGPASSTSNSVVLYDGTTGKLVKNGPALGTSGHPLVSAGAGSPPAFGQLPTAGIADLAVTEGKIAANAVGVAKLKREGSAGQILYSGGAGADPSWGAVPAAGEANTASNVGGGAGWWKDKNGVDLRFKTLKQGGVTFVRTAGDAGEPVIGFSSANFTLTENVNDITISLTINYQTSVASGGS